MRNPPNETLADNRLADGGGKRTEGPERRCILTGEVGPRDALVRLALSPEGMLLPDAFARAPGRGAWIGVDRPALAGAMASGRLRGALARAFKGARVDVPEDLPELIENALRRALLDRLGLELRSGHLILGHERIAAQARAGLAEALFHAADASDGGARKLDQALRVGRDAEGTGLAGTRLPLDRKALSVALGRDNVVHLALSNAASVQRVMVPLQRLLNFVGVAPEATEGSRVADDTMRAGPAG